LEHTDDRIDGVVCQGPDGETTWRPDHVISSMPVNHLIRRLHPSPPDPVLEAADGLRYRDFIVVALILDREHLFPDNWIYVHSPDVQVGRIQNFKNWSSAMVPDTSRTCLGLEYFCSRGDGLWETSNAELLRLAARELEAIGLARADDVEDGTVIRQPMAYPVYDGDYRGHLRTIRDYLSRFANLQTVGRAGMHRYNNQDHSMLTGLLAARNVTGEAHDVWNVNVERSYYESFEVDSSSGPR
jgi:protoporphyrinogen oxidase